MEKKNKKERWLDKHGYRVSVSKVRGERVEKVRGVTLAGIWEGGQEKVNQLTHARKLTVENGFLCLA